MGTETNVQIEVPRTGQKIRNLSIPAVQSDGTVATVLMQVVTLADSDGNLLGGSTASVWDDTEDTAWNQHASAMNFDLANNLTIDNVWES